MVMKAGDAEWIITANLKQLKAKMVEAKGIVGKTGQAILKNHKAIGAGLTAVGTAVLGSFALMTKGAAAYGDEIGKAAKRTGLSTEAISKLKHAAEQSGSSLAGIETSVKKMSMTINEARQGTSTYVDALAQLGLKAEDFKGLNTEQTFLKIGEAIGKLEDPMTKAAVAQEIFGRAGTQLIPLFDSGAEGMAQMAAEAENLGLVLSKNEAQMAEDFTDAWDELSKSMKAVFLNIGLAIIPIMKELFEELTPIISSMTEWIKANPVLTQGVLAISAALAALAIPLGGILFFLPQITLAVKALTLAKIALVAELVVFAAALAATIIAIKEYIGWINELRAAEQARADAQKSIIAADTEAQAKGFHNLREQQIAHTKAMLEETIAAGQAQFAAKGAINQKLIDKEVALLRRLGLLRKESGKDLADIDTQLDKLTVKRTEETTDKIVEVRQRSAEEIAAIESQRAKDSVLRNSEQTIALIEMTQAFKTELAKVGAHLMALTNVSKKEMSRTLEAIRKGKDNIAVAMSSLKDIITVETNSIGSQFAAMADAAESALRRMRAAASAANNLQAEAANSLSMPAGGGGGGGETTNNSTVDNSITVNQGGVNVASDAQASMMGRRLGAELQLALHARGQSI